jgi:hypothetical protein
MTADIRWYIGEDPVIVARGKAGTYTEFTRGETVDFDFYFGLGASAGEDVPLGAAYGGELAAAYGGSLAGSYGDGQRITEPIAAYEALREYGEYTAGINTATDIDGLPSYRENTPATDPVDSHVVLLRPGSEVSAHPEIIGLITGYEDDTSIAGAVARVSLEVVVLGTTEEYPSAADAREQLEA